MDYTKVKERILTILMMIFIAAMVSCSDDDLTAAEQLQKDVEIIDEYLIDNSIDAQIHSTGLRYVIHEQGRGVVPNISNNITITYEGRFLSDGNVFDSNEEITFPLSGLIPGWQIGIPLINGGGSITLYIPSGLAYGPEGRGDIPGDAILIFDIDLLAVE